MLVLLYLELKIIVFSEDVELNKVAQGFLYHLTCPRAAKVDTNYWRT